MHKKTTISILECNPLYRIMLIRMISSIDGYALEKVYHDLDSARNLLIQPSDVAIIDLEAASDVEIFGFIRKLNDLGSVTVIACSLQEDDLLMRQAFSVGLMSYVVKNCSYD